MTQRADLALVARGLFESRSKAREAIEAGLVRVNGNVLTKPAMLLNEQAEVEATAPYPWVSRGGVKLAAALQHFDINPQGSYCLDVGASTGGFTHVLLSSGAAHVVAVEVGHGQLHPSLQDDPRLTHYEYQDARLLTLEHLKQPPSLIVCDASFISLKILLPPVLRLAAQPAQLIALIKPQFEAGRSDNKKGIVRDAKVHQQICADMIGFFRALGWIARDIIASPIAGGDGNQEFLMCADKS